MDHQYQLKKQQQAHAEEVLGLSAHLSEVENSFQAASVVSEQKAKQLEKQVRTLQHDLANAQRVHRGQLQSVEALEQQVEKLEQAAQLSQEENTRLSKVNRELEVECSKLRTKDQSPVQLELHVESLTTQLRASTEVLEQHKASLSKHEAAAKASKKDLKSKLHTIARLEAQVVAVEHDAAMAQTAFRQQADDLKAQLASRLNTSEELLAALRSAQADVQQERAEVERVKQELLASRKAVQQLELQVDELEAEREQNAKALQQLQDRVQAHEETEAQLQQVLFSPFALACTTATHI